MGMNVVLAVVMVLPEWNEGHWFPWFSMLSLIWNLVATLVALVVGGRALAKGFLFATGLLSLASFALCATLGFAL